MGENREYAIHGDDKGSINISADVLATVAAGAAMEVEGVAGLCGPISKEIVERLGGKKNGGKGIKVTTEEEQITLDIYAEVRLGYAIHDVASKVQEAVAAAVESMTGFAVKAVNVTVCGVSLEK